MIYPHNVRLTALVQTLKTAHVSGRGQGKGSTVQRHAIFKVECLSLVCDIPCEVFLIDGIIQPELV